MVCRLAIEQDKNHQSEQEISILRRELMNKDQDYKTATLAIKKPLDDLEKLQSDHDATIRENEDLKRRCTDVLF